MALQAVCPECEATFRLPEEQAGKRVRCKNCRAVFTVVAPRQSAPEGATTRAKPAAVAAPAPAAAPAADRSAAPRPTTTNNLPWIIGGAVACTALLAVGAIGVAMVLKPSATPIAASPQAPLPQPVAPVVQPLPLPMPVAPPPPVVEKAKPPEQPVLAPVGDGKMSREAVARVKRATVRIHVTLPDGRQSSGTGFFGVPESNNLILTNAHVVGMLSADSRKPKSVEIFLNSGEKDQHKTAARILGVDRHSDLAVLDVGTTAGMPAPLNVRPAATLNELDPVTVFGFPLGTQLGEEITIRPTSVSSLRKRAGVLEKVQVAGGMDPGNSGGPVVDANGDVIGVAVSGIEGRLINFAIPGERVHTILNGRLSALGVGTPYLEGGKVHLPISMEMLDPRNRIEKAYLEVWTGNRSAAPPRPSDSAPEARPGDTERIRVELPYAAGMARGEVALPDLPVGKVYWLQPIYGSAGQLHWVAGQPKEIKREDAVERKPAKLVVRHQTGASRNTSLSMKNTFRVSSDEDADASVLDTNILLRETAAADANGVALRFAYQEARSELLVSKNPPRPNPRLALLQPHLKRLVAVLLVDARGNPVPNGNRVDMNALAGRPVRPGELPMDEVALELLKFHRPTQHALEAMAIPLPNEDNVAPGKSWKATRTLPMDTPGKYESGQMEMTYTYLGQRTRGGRTEAVIALDGVVRGGDGNDAVGGQATGTALIDLATGQVILAETRSVVDMKAQLGDSGKSIDLIATLETRMDRGF